VIHDNRADRRTRAGHWQNDFGQRLFGYGEEELIGRSVLDLIVPDTEEAWAATLSR